MANPLENIRVLDFGQYVAGPAAAAILADQGAEVIRIDPPGGPRWDSPAMDSLNRRKKSIVLDLKNAEDLAIAGDLIATSDVLIENFRPGVMDRLHLGAREAHNINPRLIYSSLPGFARHDKERAHLQAWEGIIAAASGQFTDMGLNRVLMGVNPSFSPLTLASAYAALLAATSISAALLAREESGHGDWIEVPIAAALMEGLVFNSMYIEDCPERYLSLREHEIKRRGTAGQPLDMSYDEIQEYMDPFYRSYFCKDGRPIYLVATCHVSHCHKTLKAMGLYEEMREAGLTELDDWYLPISRWPAGVESPLGLYPLNKKWSDIVSKRMKEIFLEKTSFEWEAFLSKAGVPISVHRKTQEWMNSEHPYSVGVIHEVNDPIHGLKRQAGPVAWLSSSADLAGTPSPAPPLDGDREQILASLQEKSEKNRKEEKKAGTVSFTDDRCWLQGVKVLDMTNVIAGPVAGHTLARFGADVIKLDPIKPTFDPWNSIIIGFQVLQGKKSILADIRNEDGKVLLHRLLQWADVITFNGIDRQLKSLGIDPDSLKAVNPQLILLQLDCWGGPKEGPRSGDLGYDDLVQASTGIMSRFGGSIQSPEEHAHLGTIDVLTGFAGAFAVTTALYKRKKTGVADVARTSLIACGQLLQAPFCYDYEGRAPFDEPGGPEAKGDGPFYRCYQASDGWFFLAAPGKTARDLEDIEGLKGCGDLAGNKLEQFLESCFAGKGMDHWIKRFTSADMGAAALESLSLLREKNGSDYDTESNNSWTRESTFQFTSHKNHPSGHRIDIFSPCSIRPQYASLLTPTPAEKIGTKTRTVLKDLGYSPEETQRLFEEGVVSESWSDQYLPD
ncbi:MULTISPECIES: CoA transferase [unclassified Oceanispirochaeta]|uniref:CoA transferase n=1 Tax=unclassified Oceanispirochaeta TaxID=2635722 RepID=UPI000E08DA20|nr:MULTISPECIES: CoA transferase [unclassified Oceanispirochaeta]MBF9015116.1 CoA transferase [Oceanispirochaeta sp. M2]NPD71574.1 hypothetical protein [Oceanispirochaeta sp. M1]RDG33142.1 carnitine dehydratase [Oceanispirochaeta sp. M1]